MLQANQTVRKESYWYLMLASLRYRDFRLVWLGSFSEHLGEFMEIAASLWLTNQLTHSPLMLTIVGAARYFAMVFMPMIGGVVADRMNRRTLLMITLVGLGALSVILAILTMTDLIAVWHLIAIGTFVGAVISFNHPARQSIVPNLVKREHLLNAVSLDFLSIHVGILISMLIVGYLLNIIGPGPVFLLRAVGCFMAIGWLLMARIPPTPDSSRKNAPWHNVKEGYHYLLAHAILIGLILVLLLPRAVTVTYQSFSPIYANDILAVGAIGYGYLQAAPGLGAILASLGLGMLTYSRAKARILAFSGIVIGAGLISFSLSTWYYPSLLFAVVIGAADSAFTTLNSALIQGAVSDDVRGRMMSWREITFGLGPIWSILFGAIAQSTGVPTSLVILGIIAILVALVLVIFLPKFSKIE